MEVTVKVRFNASKERVESFGGNKYMMYLPFEEDNDSISIIISLLSRYLGVPPNRIDLKNRNSMTGDLVFYVN